jgi:hypothetical protein
MGKGGGSPPPSSSTVTQTNLPEYVEPYFKRLLERTESESKREYTPYSGDRLAGTSADIKAVEGRNEKNGSTRVRPILAKPMDTTRAGIQACLWCCRIPPRSVSLCRVKALLSLLAQRASPDLLAQADQQGFPDIRSQVQQFRGPSAVSQFSQVGPSGEFDAAAAQQYMDPYMQQVVNVQKREAIQEAQKAKAGRAAQAIGAGAFGGSREGIVRSEAAESLQKQLGDIQAIGSQQAFKQAQEQFERDRAAQEWGKSSKEFQVEQAQEQAVRRFEDMGFSREQAQEQAFRQMEQQRMAQEQAQADLVSRFEEAGFSREQAQESAQRQMEQQRFETEKARESAIQARYNQLLQAQQAQEQARLAGAQFGLEGLKTGMAGAEQLAELGAKGQGLTIEQLRSLEQVGKAEQARRQQALDMAYQDYMRQRDYPREQLQFYSSILRGVPVSPSQEQATYQQVNPLQQLLGTGLAGLSLYKGLGG